MQDWLDRLGPVFLPDPVNWQHPLNQGRAAWWQGLPGIDGGIYWYDLTRLNPAILTSASGATPVWSSSLAPGDFPSLRFSGPSSYADAGQGIWSQAGQTSFTIAAWVNTAVNTASPGSGGRRYIASTESGTAGWMLRYAPTGTTGNNRFEFYVYEPGGVLIGPATYLSPATFTWYRVVATYTRGGGASNGLVLYVNGVKASSVTENNAGTSLGGNLWIGTTSAATARVWNGWIGDVSFWTRALSAVEITADYELSRLAYPGVLNRLSPSLWPAAGVPPPPPTITTWPAAMLGYL